MSDDLQLSQAWVEALKEAHDYDVPPALLARLRRRAPVPQAVRWAVLALGVLIVNHGMGNIFIGRWIADQTHGHYDPHTFRESAIAIVAIGMLCVLAYFRTSWIRAATVIGGSAGLAFGVHGFTEVTKTPYGFALHFAEGVAAVVLFVLWRRYAKGAPPEEGA